VTASSAGVYENLADGTSYKVSVSKDGYKTTEKDLKLGFVFVDPLNPVNVVVLLWNGPSTGKVKMNGMPMSVASHPELAIIGSTAKLPKPEYPVVGKGVSGSVQVQVIIDETGRVDFARAVSGNPIFRSSAVDAAKKAKFHVTIIEGLPVSVTGFLTYNFVP
jgi:TonB family protein